MNTIDNEREENILCCFPATRFTNDDHGLVFTELNRDDQLKGVLRKRERPFLKEPERKHVPFVTFKIRPSAPVPSHLRFKYVPVLRCMRLICKWIYVVFP